MPITDFHQALAEKFMFKNVWENTLVPDSLLKLVKFVYTEEEAEIVNALTMTPLPAWAIARKVKRPVSEVAPILQSLGDRLLIISLKVKGVNVYAFMNLAPGVFEAQMCQGKDDDYNKEFAHLFEQVYEEIFTWLKPRIEGKDFRFGRIIPIERAIESTPGLSVIAFDTDKYSEMVDRNNSFCLIKECSCRHEKYLIGEWCGKPKDYVCSAMGVLADIAVEKGMAKRVSKAEFYDAKARAADAGLVNMVDNMEDPLQVCSCCGCCCGALRILTEFNIPSIITQSHFEATISPEKCAGCGTCVKICPMKAIKVTKKKASVDYARCIGCGVCVTKCEENKSITLKERKPYKPPEKTLGEFALNRYFEYKGYDNPFLPKLSLGIGRLFSKVVPVHWAGPQYKSR